MRVGRRPLYIGLLIAGLGLIATAWHSVADERARNLGLDLGVEIIGLGLTVSILDWFFERRRLLAEGRRLAWELYYAIERIAWVWQGGPRRLDAEEVIGLLEGARRGHGLSDGTEHLVYGLGVRSRQVLRGEHNTVYALPRLREALEALVALAKARKDYRRSLHPHRVSEALRKALAAVLQILEIEPSFVPDLLIRDRDASPEAQRKRYETELRAHPLVPP